MLTYYAAIAFTIGLAIVVTAANLGEMMLHLMQ